MKKFFAFVPIFALIFAAPLFAQEYGAEYYFERAYANLVKGNADAAIADYTEAIHLEPNLAEAYVCRANVYCEKGDLDTAIADYDEAIRLKPDLVDAWYNRGLAHYENGEAEAAIDDYVEALRLEPDIAGYIEESGDEAAKRALEIFLEDSGNAQ
jgi:tetratricopeptide (TPR) repeat protein